MKKILYIICDTIVGTFVVFLLVIALILLPIFPFRQHLITRHLFRFFKKVMPPISETEKAALVAGNMGEEVTLLYKPNWRKIFSPASWGKITEEEERYLNGPVEKLCAMIDDYKISRTREIPDEVWRQIIDMRIFAMNMHKEDGGLGFSKTAQARIITKIASRSLSVAVICMVPNSLGPPELLHYYGTEAQKKRFLPGLANGTEIAAFALTSPSAGSDAGGSMQDTGIVYRREDGTPMMRLNWSKRYITLGPICTLLGLGFKLYDPELILGCKKDLGITVALIPINAETKAAGVNIGREHDPLGATFYNGPNSGTDVCLPIEDYVIGGLGGVGEGWKMLMECLGTGRFVSLPSTSVGGMKFASASVGAYAAIREQFRTALANFGGVEEYLSEMVGLTYLSECMLYVGTDIVDNGGTSPVLSAIAKYHATRNMEEVLRKGMDILGGKGIQLGPKNFLARLYSGLKIAITVEGANILTRCMIIFGQGLIRCHPWLLKEMLALEIEDKKAALREFDIAFMGHFWHFYGVLLRRLFYGFGGLYCSRVTTDAFAEGYYKEMNRMSNALGLLSEFTLLFLGGGLKKEERISALLGDVLSHLYQGGAVLKRYQDEDHPRHKTRLPTQWCLEYSLYKIQEALIEVCDNFPSRMAGRILRRVIFPFGRIYKKPSHALEKKLAHMITDVSYERYMITDGVYFPPLDDLENEPLALLEVTLRKIRDTRAISDKLKAARKQKVIRSVNDLAEAVKQGVITEIEKVAMEEVEAFRNQVIAVDDFADLARHT